MSTEGQLKAKQEAKAEDDRSVLHGSSPHIYRA